MSRVFIVIFCSLFSVLVSAQRTEPSPNVLVIMFDDAGLDMSAYGSSYVKTPGFDRVAKEGILFKRAYTPNAKCAPSRASFITGRNTWELGAAANHYIYFPPYLKTYQEVLLEKGYETGHTGKGYGPGITVNEDGSQREVLGPSYNLKKLVPATTSISTNDYAENFIDFLNKVPESKPWSFWVGSTEPHRGYAYGSGAKLGKKRKEMIKDFPSYWPDNEITRNDLLDYAFEIEDTDKHISKILEVLEDRNKLENTLIIVTSDHGMPFPRVKGDQYENANHVPLAIMWKGNTQISGRTVDDYVSFIDFAPTILEVAGISWQESEMYPSSGNSLVNILTSDKSGQIEKERNFVLVGKERHDTGRPNDVGYPIRGIYKDSMLYIHNYEIDRWPSGNPETGYLNTDGSPTKSEILKLRRADKDKTFWKLNFGKRPEEELYNIKKDPFCMINLVVNEGFQEIKNSLRAIMEKKLIEQNDLRMQGFGHVYELHPLSGGAGFFEKFMNGENPKAGWVSESDFEPFYLDGEGNEIKPVLVPKN